MSQSKRVRVHLNLDDEVYATLKHFARLKKEPVATLMRRILSQELDTKSTDEPDRLTLAVRRAIRDTLKPVEEGLARLAVKATIAAATGMYLGVQCAGDLGAKGVVDMHKQAEIMAVEHLRQREDEIEEPLGKEGSE